MNSYSVLIADDEPNARMYLRRLLAKDDEIQIVKECKNGSEVIAHIEQNMPDIMFLDIEMPGLTGIEIASYIKSSTAVIFTTAFDQYAINAFEFEVLDYLLKPFEEDRFRQSVNRGKKFVDDVRHRKLSDELISMIEHFQKKEITNDAIIEIKKKGFIKKIYSSEIIFIEASSVYAEINSLDGKELYRSSLNELEELLPSNFIRVHRAYIINLSMVETVRYQNDNTYEFHLKSDIKIKSGRTYKQQILDKL